MAATDQTYRSQRGLDIVFAVSSVVMLLSVIWMFAQDYYRPYKTEQRRFRDVEVGVAQRVALGLMPTKKEFEAARQAFLDAKKERANNAGKIKEYEKEIAEREAIRQKREITFQSWQSKFNSIVSFYDSAVDEYGPDHAITRGYKEEINNIGRTLSVKKAERDAVVSEVRKYQTLKQALEKPFVDARTRWKKTLNDFETQVLDAAGKRWTIYDWIRNLPVLDGFADPIKIKQFTLEDVPIDYNFKYVTRFDRCMSCHLGIDKPAYTKEMLHSLGDATDRQRRQLWVAQELLKEHRAGLKGLPEQKDVPTPADMNLVLVNLTKEHMNEYCAHPRLDLFVGPNSKHPAEKFGCTSCHQGQGSATEFSLAAHTPNSMTAMKRWKNDTKHGWDRAQQHFWDFPMLPARFVESSCLKCHHEVTDLISVDNRIEAPKVYRGFNIIREFGCFGCHEIKGRKYNRPIGPDLRLEPTPPLEDLPPAERDRLVSDPDNLPGTYRKVGPSLYRLAEKTNEAWAVKWLRAPRAFRPDTRMPHFYGLSNNRPEALPAEDKKKKIVGQKEFPDAEMHAVVDFLFKESREYLIEVEAHQNDPEGIRQADRDLVSALSIRPPASLTKEEKKALDQAKWNIRLREAAPRIKPLLKDYSGDAANGRSLFSIKGCLACHRHESLEKADGPLPAIVSEAQFGPNLSQIKDKLGKSGDAKSAGVWLQNWIKKPQNHSPRSAMPVAVMTDKEIVDVTAWLLEQSASSYVGKEWATLKVEPTNDAALKKLSKVYLTRLLSKTDLEKLDNGEKLDKIAAENLPDAERELVADYSPKNIRHYVGLKAVNRLGCYACHDIPGMDNAKPIGVGLNDWGKKPPDRLAFEDIVKYVEEHYHRVDSLTTTATKRVGRKVMQVTVPQPFEHSKDHHGKTIVKKPYEKFFFDLLEHHSRIGFLNQKLTEPRSYDFNRIRKWDDRARMPQFRFARTIRKKNESDSDFAARKWKDEAEAREAVMTFILGLVAEKVPIKTINRPTGDRLAQVKGRQVLQKFNCAGCHLIRPGLYEFNLNSETHALLQKSFDGQSLEEDFDFYDHHAWMGGDVKDAKGRMKVFGVPRQIKDFVGRGRKPYLQPDATDKSKKNFHLRLTQAVRYYDEVEEPKTKVKKVVSRDVRAAEVLWLRPSQMIYPPPSAFGSVAKFQEFEKDKGAFGGAFTDLLARYLMQRFPKDYEENIATGDNNFARAAAPPSLIGQGGRTQPGWLYQFLRNPQKVREMTVLRMPKFSLSEEDAQTLANYFTAVERLTNPRFQINDGAANIPQKGGLDDSYWRERTRRYVERLKDPKLKVGGKTLYEQRLEELKPLWKRIAAGYNEELKEAEKNYQEAAQRKKEFDEESKKLEDKLKKAKDADEKKKLAEQKKLRTEQGKLVVDLFTTWERRKEALKTIVEESSEANMIGRWEQRDAYAVDAFKLLANSQVCGKCHQVGSRIPTQKEKGPSLALAHNRLQPDWIKHWVARPNRLVTYPSPMIVYFPHNQPKQWQQLFAGSPKERIRALSDVLMIYQETLDMPVNRYWIYPVAKKKED